MQYHHQPTTTIAILGSDTVVESAPALLRRGKGYDDTRHFEEDPTGFVEELLDGVDLLLLAPGRAKARTRPS